MSEARDRGVVGRRPRDVGNLRDDAIDEAIAEPTDPRDVDGSLTVGGSR